MTHDRIEQLDSARRRMLLGFLIAFVAWQTPTLVSDLVGGALPKAAQGGLAILAILAWVTWLVYGTRLWRLRRTIGKDPRIAAALDDERVTNARLRALAFAFWAELVFLVVIRLLAFLRPLPASSVALAGIIVAAVAAIGGFLYYDRA